MTEDEIFIDIVKAAIDKYQVVNGIFFNKTCHGYIGCANNCKQNVQKIKITKLYDFNKI